MDDRERVLALGNVFAETLVLGVLLRWVVRINKKTRRGIGARLASRTNIVRLEVGIVVADLEEEAKQVQQLRVVAVGLYYYFRVWIGEGLDW